MAETDLPQYLAGIPASARSIPAEVRVRSAVPCGLAYSQRISSAGTGLYQSLSGSWADPRERHGGLDPTTC